MLIANFEFPQELYYDEHHQYARVEGNLVTVGLSQFAQSAAREIAFVGLPRPGRKVQAGKPIGSIESGKWVGRVYAPVSGEVTAVNTALDDDPSAINRDPYAAGWLLRITAADLGELAALRRVSDPDFAQWFQAEAARIAREAAR
jgi:glycine cleavage system H protein